MIDKLLRFYKGRLGAAFFSAWACLEACQRK